MPRGVGTRSVLEKGSFYFALNASRGFAFNGGHPETKGLSSNGQVITVPLHRHEISLDYLRIEFELEYAVTDKWSLLFRVPYEVKDQNAEVRFIEPANAEKRQAMLSNQNIHHRTETYRGVSDVMLLATHNKQGLFREGDSMKISAGTTLPTGKTEEDVYKLGDKGLKHLHIQFGTGTFNPLLELNYSMPLARQFSLSAYALGRFPFYENHKNYEGPVEMMSGLTLSYRPNSQLLFHLNSMVYYQHFAYWAGEKDINSGLVTTSGALGAQIKAWENTTLSVDVLYPFSQNILSVGDTFKQGPTVLFGISQTLR